METEQAAALETVYSSTEFKLAARDTLIADCMGTQQASIPSGLMGPALCTSRSTGNCLQLQAVQVKKVCYAPCTSA